jgi:hypothetical protein
MKIFGFSLLDDSEWSDDPFGGGRIPEDEICEVCHIHFNSAGDRFIGIDVALGLSEEEMSQILSPYSRELRLIKVIV